MSRSLAAIVGLISFGHLSVEARRCTGRLGAVSAVRPSALQVARQASQERGEVSNPARFGTSTPLAQVLVCPEAAPAGFTSTLEGASTGLLIAAFNDSTFSPSASTHVSSGNSAEAFTVRRGRFCSDLRSTEPHGKSRHGSAGSPAKTDDHPLERRRSISRWQRSTFGAKEARWG